MDFYFEKQDGNIVCADREGGVRFLPNRQYFEHREWRLRDDALLFDGYSNWFYAEGEAFRGLSDFTFSFLFAPEGYAVPGDGLFSFFDREEAAGFAVRLEKHGKVTVEFGDGHWPVSFGSIHGQVRKCEWNAVTAVFRQEAGWCDLYINGILSNRKQFRRHAPLCWPEGRVYLGKYVDRKPFGEEAPVGVFYGLMKRVCLEARALSDREVKALHESWPLGEATGPIPLDRGLYRDDVQRPQYHLIAPGKWMNEPHAPFWYRGYYHIFYQANPHAPIWNNIQWGHLVSRDMVHWEDMPLALQTEETGPDPDGCWSGSALVDREGCPRIFYSAGNDADFPNQAVAMAWADPEGGDKLPAWKKHPVCVVRQQEGWMGEFRDPFVWLENGTYFMLVGSGDADNGGGNAVLFSSDDLLNWTSHGFAVDYDYEKNTELGHVWELPVLLPLRDENGGVVRHILMFCACQIENDVVETYGFLGKWDPVRMRFEKDGEKAILLDLGHGTFTGGCGFVTPDLRSVVFTIAQGKRGGRKECQAGWAHNGGLPVELSVRDGRFHIQPVGELASLRRQCLLCLQDVSGEEADRQLAGIRGNRLYLRLEADGEQAGVTVLYGEKEKTVRYMPGTGCLEALDETGVRVSRYRGEIDRVEPDGETVTLELYLDHSMIEAYLNGRKSVTLRDYIKGAGERGLRLAGKIRHVERLEVWEMDSAYPKDP